MNDLVVGMGEALWDVLPEGKKIGGRPPISHITFLNSDFRAVWSAQWATMISAGR